MQVENTGIVCCWTTAHQSKMSKSNSRLRMTIRMVNLKKKSQKSVMYPTNQSSLKHLVAHLHASTGMLQHGICYEVSCATQMASNGLL